MAVDFKVEHTRTSEYLFLPENVTFKPELNGRHDLPNIEWLVESMSGQLGQIQPVIVRNDGGKPVLVAGFSRWRAAVEINKRLNKLRRLIRNRQESRCGKRLKTPHTITRTRLFARFVRG